MNYEQSAEDYLERILMLTQHNGKVRSIDVVNDMGFSKPSISIAMKKLKEKGFVDIDNSGYITLTDEGLKIANRTLQKHQVIYEALIKIGVNEKTAYEDACKIEHDISEETFCKIKNKLEG